MLARNRVRRIFGLILMVYYVLLATSMGWNWLVHREEFSVEIWLRFWGVSWLAAVLFLTGCWLTIPSRLLGIAALATFGIPVTYVAGMMLIAAKFQG
jgi:hypothetical protein